jgi:hypothetical protein
MAKTFITVAKVPFQVVSLLVDIQMMLNSQNTSTYQKHQIQLIFSQNVQAPYDEVRQDSNDDVHDDVIYSNSRLY